jgi:hypothetical protein
MALVDPVGPSPVPLYDPSYPNDVGKAKEEAGVGASVLDQSLGHFREEFRRDPAFEVLHFLPLYFPQAGRTEVLEALDLLAGTREGLPRAPSPRTSFGIAAVGSVLTTQRQRQTLGEFVGALRQEWDGFFGAWWRGKASDRNELEASVQTVWRTEFEPALAPFLTGMKTTGGLVTLVPAVGTEGRIFTGIPQSAVDNVLVIAAPDAPAEARGAAYSMLRELSFPLARQTLEKSERPASSREEEERLTGRAAIRTGAMILEMLLPKELASYHRFFVAQAGGSAVTAATERIAFETMFPVNVELEKALQEEVLSTVRDGGEG